MSDPIVPNSPQSHSAPSFLLPVSDWDDGFGDEEELTSHTYAPLVPIGKRIITSPHPSNPPPSHTVAYPRSISPGSSSALPRSLHSSSASTASTASTISAASASASASASVSPPAQFTLERSGGTGGFSRPHIFTPTLTTTTGTSTLQGEESLLVLPESFGDHGFDEEEDLSAFTPLIGSLKSVGSSYTKFTAPSHSSTKRTIDLIGFPSKTTTKFFRRVVRLLSGSISPKGKDLFQTKGNGTHTEDISYLRRQCNIDVIINHITDDSSLAKSNLPVSKDSVAIVVFPESGNGPFGNLPVIVPTGETKWVVCRPPSAEDVFWPPWTKQEQIHRFSPRSWDSLEWKTNLLDVLIPCPLFDFSSVQRTPLHMTSTSRGIVSQGAMNIKLLDREQRRCIMTINPLRDIPPLLPRQHATNIKREVQYCVSDDEELLIIRAFADTPVSYDIFVAFHLLSGAPKFVITPDLNEKQMTGNDVSVGSICCLDDKLFVSHKGEILSDGLYIYAITDLVFSINTTTGAPVNFLEAPNRATFSNHVYVWERTTGKLANVITVETPALHIAVGGENIAIVTSSGIVVRHKVVGSVVGTFAHPTKEMLGPCTLNNNVVVGSSLHSTDSRVESICTLRAALIDQLQHCVWEKDGTFSGIHLVEGSDLLAAVSLANGPKQLLFFSTTQWSSHPVKSLTIPLSHQAARTLSFIAETSKKKENWQRIKLYLLGEENVGKTNFAHRLKGQKYGVDMSTDGVDIGDQDEGDVLFRIMDFAGQSVFFPTHEFFITGKALYVIMFNLADLQWKRISYWLSVVASLGAITPIVCVGTHLDKFKGGKSEKEVIEKKLRKLKYGSRVHAIYFINGLQSAHSKEVKQCLVDLAKSQHLLKKEFPSSYRKIDALVEHMNHKYLTWAGWSRMFRYDDAELKRITQFLHETGSVIWIKDSPLSDLVILDLQWLSELLSSLISFKVNWTDGKLLRPQIDAVWRAYPEQLRDKFIQLLERMELVYPVTGSRGNEWLIPSMFSQSPSAKFSKLSSALSLYRPTSSRNRLFSRQYTLKHIPMGLFPRLLTRILQDVVFRDLNCDYWKNGIVIQYHSHEVALVESIDDHSLHVVVEKPYSDTSTNRDSFPVIIQALEHMLISFKIEDVERLIPCPHCLGSNGDVTSCTYFKVEEIIKVFSSGGRTVECRSRFSGVANLPIEDLAPDLCCVGVPRLAVPVEKVKIGEGAYGFVYSATLPTGETVAIKESKFSDSLDEFQEFVHEVTIMRMFNHVNVVALYGLSFHPLSMIMELCPLGSLDELLYEDQGIEHFPIFLQLAVARDIAEGLRALHTQCFPPLVHRDIRSPNIFMVSLDPTAPVRAKIGDFGLSRQAAPHLSDMLQTWQWVAPEVMDAIRPMYDERSDVFSFAMVFSEIVRRELPYSEYDDYVLKQEHQLTREQINDKNLISKLKGEGMRVDMEKMLAISEVWQEQSIKTAICTRNLRPTVSGFNLPKEVEAVIYRAWENQPTERPSMEEIVTILTSSLSSLSSGARGHRRVISSPSVNREISKKTTSRSLQTAWTHSRSPQDEEGHHVLSLTGSIGKRSYFHKTEELRRSKTTRTLGAQPNLLDQSRTKERSNTMIPPTTPFSFPFHSKPPSPSPTPSSSATPSPYPPPSRTPPPFSGSVSTPFPLSHPTSFSTTSPPPSSFAPPHATTSLPRLRRKGPVLPPPPVGGYAPTAADLPSFPPPTPPFRPASTPPSIGSRAPSSVSRSSPSLKVDLQLLRPNRRRSSASRTQDPRSNRTTVRRNSSSGTTPRALTGIKLPPPSSPRGPSVGSSLSHTPAHLLTQSQPPPRSTATSPGRRRGSGTGEFVLKRRSKVYQLDSRGSKTTKQSFQSISPTSSGTLPREPFRLGSQRSNRPQMTANTFSPPSSPTSSAPHSPTGRPPAASLRPPPH